MKKRDFTLIDYKGPSEKRYKKYIGIGGYDWEAVCIIPYECKIPSSLLGFREKCLSKEASTYSIETIKRLLYEYKDEDREYFKEVYQQELICAIENNLESINQFFEKWYRPDDYLFFKGLDFVYFGEDDISKEIWNKDGNTTKVICKDGSSMRIITVGDSWHQYYVLESDFDEFKKDYDKLIGCF